MQSRREDLLARYLTDVAFRRRVHQDQESDVTRDERETLMRIDVEAAFLAAQSFEHKRRMKAPRGRQTFGEICSGVWEGIVNRSRIRWRR